MEVVEKNKQQAYQETPTKHASLSRAEKLRLASGWIGMGLTVPGLGSLAYALYASSSVFFIPAGALGGPGVVLLLGTCLSYCCVQDESEETLTLMPEVDNGAPTQLTNSPTFSVPSTAGDTKYEKVRQEWLASQQELEAKLRRKSSQVSEATESKTDSTNESDTGTTIQLNLPTGRQTKHNSRHSHRNPRVRSGVLESEGRQATRTRTTSDAGNRISRNLENTSTSVDVEVDETADLEQEHARLLADWHASQSDVESDSDRSS